MKDVAEKARISKKRGGLKQYAYENLKEQIIYCELLPGSIIHEGDLCEKLHIGRTPVREALQQLAQEGYIEIEQRKSTSVSKISLSEAREIIDLRLMVEPVIVRQIDGPLLPEKKSKLLILRDRFLAIQHSHAQEVELKSSLMLDYDFHMCLIGLSENQLILNTMGNLLQHCIRYWYFMYKTMNQRLQRSLEEHLTIIDQINRGDFERASFELRNHIEKCRELDCFA